MNCREHGQGRRARFGGGVKTTLTPTGCPLSALRPHVDSQRAPSPILATVATMNNIMNNEYDTPEEAIAAVLHALFGIDPDQTLHHIENEHGPISE